MWTALLLTLPLAGSPVPAEVTLPVSLPVQTIERVLASELRRSGRDVLDNFQIVCTKFREGRIELTDLSFRPAGTENHLGITARARLVFRRKQLGVKWRGLKSHKTWTDHGREIVARVRIDGDLEVVPRLDRPLAGASIDFRMTDLRFTIESRLRPIHGLTASFRLRDRVERWRIPTELPGILGEMELSRLDVVPVVRRGRVHRVEVTAGLRRQHELLAGHGDAAEHQ